MSYIYSTHEETGEVVTLDHLPYGGTCSWTATQGPNFWWPDGAPTWSEERKAAYKRSIVDTSRRMEAAKIVIQ